jgi:hypothetical protein
VYLFNAHDLATYRFLDSACLNMLANGAGGFTDNVFVYGEREAQNERCQDRQGEDICDIQC